MRSRETKNKVTIMLDIIIKVLLIMAVLFAFALPGFLLRKTNLVRSDSLYSVSNILLCFAQPMLIIQAFAVDPVAPTKETLLNFLWVLLFSFAALFLTFFAAKLVFLYKKLRVRGHPLRRYVHGRRQRGDDVHHRLQRCLQPAHLDARRLPHHAGQKRSLP